MIITPEMRHDLKLWWFPDYLEVQAIEEEMEETTDKTELAKLQTEMDAIYKKREWVK